MTKQAPSIAARLLRAIRSGDAALLKRTADAADDEVAAEEKRIADEEAEAEKKKTEDTIAGLTKSMDALTALVTKLTKDGMGPTEGLQGSADKVDTGENPIGDEEPDDDGKKKAEDEEPDDAEKKKTADAMRHTMQRAELLVPGFKLPTADSAVRRFTDVIGVQRKVLVAALKTADAKEVVESFLDGRTIDALSGADVTSTFIGASMVMRSQNNASGARRGVQTNDFSKPVTPADINARNQAFWANR